MLEGNPIATVSGVGCTAPRIILSPRATHHAAPPPPLTRTTGAAGPWPRSKHSVLVFSVLRRLSSLPPLSFENVSSSFTFECFGSGSKVKAYEPMDFFGELVRVA